MITAVLAAAMGAVSGWALFGLPADWWLNSGAGVRRVLIGLSVAAFASGAFVRGFALLVGAGAHSSRSAWVIEPLCYWAAALVVMIVVLFTQPGGPGTIFPIVIAIGGALTAGAVVAGWLAGAGAVTVVGRLVQLPRAE